MLHPKRKNEWCFPGHMKNVFFWLYDVTCGAWQIEKVKIGKYGGKIGPIIAYYSNNGDQNRRAIRLELYIHEWLYRHYSEPFSDVSK